MAGADGPLVAFPKGAALLDWEPKSPVDGRGCWFEAWFPDAPKLDVLPPKPPKAPPVDGWFGVPVLMLVNGLAGDGAEPNDEKLKDEPPPPEPKENWEEPF